MRVSGGSAPAPLEAGDGLLNFIERASRDPEFDVDKFGELLRMQRELVQERARREFNAAMAAAQAEMGPIIRDAVNPHTRSKYARLETIDQAMRPIYTRHGFAVRFGSAPSPREGWLRIVCTVSHIAGYSEVNYLDAPPDDEGLRGGKSKTGVQGIGSVVSYLRRYLLVMVFNIVLADDDDDGEAPRVAPPTRREQINAEVPVDQPKPRLTPEQFLDSLELALKDARTPEAINALLDSERVLKARERAQGAHRERLEAMVAEAAARATPAPAWDTDLIGDLLVEIAGMDLIALDRLAGDAQWRARVRAATKDFPPDEQRIREAIEARRAALKP